MTYFDGALPPEITAQLAEDKRPVVVIDPGHGYFLLNGAVVEDHKLEFPHPDDPSILVRESQLALDLSLILAEKLEALGYRVVLTRTTNTPDDPLPDQFQSRIDVANQENAQFFISMHLNNLDGHYNRLSGPQMFYHTNAGKDSSGYRMAKDIIDAFLNTDIPEGQRLKAKKFQVLEPDGSNGHGTRPAVLFENFYLNNDENIRKYTQPEHQHAYMQQLADAIDTAYWNEKSRQVTKLKPSELMEKWPEPIPPLPFMPPFPSLPNVPLDTLPRSKGNGRG